jgi:hypothetical protein
MYKIFAEELEGKRPLGKPKCRREDNIEMDLKCKEYGCMH